MSLTSIIVLSVISALGVYIYFTITKIKKGTLAKDNDKIKILTAANFQNQVKSGITLVDFWADLCMPCKMMVPVLNSVAEEIDNTASVGKVNIEQFQSIAQKYMIKSIPTLILFKNGKEMNRFVGVKSKEYLINQINNYK